MDASHSLPDSFTQGANPFSSIEGDNATPQPGMFDLKGKAKWNAWTGKKGLSKADAQKKYIDLVKSLQA